MAERIKPSTGLLTAGVSQRMLTSMATKNERLVTSAGSREPSEGLPAVRELRELSEQMERTQVANARRKGWSWQEIADALGVTRQAVHKKHSQG
jgi:DNA-binding NarL/FixJ family response regulator